MTHYAINRKTGKRHLVNSKLSKAAKLGARLRKNKKLPLVLRLKIGTAIKKVYRTGKTKYGRKTKLKMKIHRLKTNR